MKTKELKKINMCSIPILLLINMVLVSSCSVQNTFTKKQNINKDTTLFSFYKPYEYTIRRDDKISVSVWNHEDLSVGSLFGIYNSNEVYGKWVPVDVSGQITLPKIGPIHIQGKTIKEAESQLIKQYENLVVNPIVKLKVLNREVSVLGEVKNPGNVLLEKERNNLLEVIARAGDFEFYADKRFVRLVRTSGTEAKQYELNFTTLTDFEKSSILVQPGDVIYVPTRKGKLIDKKAPTLIPFASALTTAAIFFSLFRK